MGLAVIATVDGRVPDALQGTLDLVQNPQDITAVVQISVLSRDAVPALDFARQAWLVESRPQWDGAAGEQRDPSRPVPGIKQVTLLRRAEGIDRGEFARHWTEVHAPLARRHHPLLWRYRQNIVVAPLLPGMDDDIDGIAELGMRLRQDFVDRMYDSPEGRRVVGADVRQFIDLRRSRQFLTREYTL